MTNFRMFVACFVASTDESSHPSHIVVLFPIGTRGSPEPFVYTGCRADTVINSGDKAL